MLHIIQMDHDVDPYKYQMVRSHESADEQGTLFMRRQLTVQVSNIRLRAQASPSVCRQSTLGVRGEVATIGEEHDLR